ncbi:T9SS type A sorting domain-containing protein [Reichenbachiella carrageenanivorans]|uniref:T9SS type A sorting domain-containing protein n=1 Tax=Reichenbachiella carrageenanivorans TaxID=2979869 RepID=A0ABY6D4F9_9BACT|nr:T9SS type A sorting domain-containing protein [Reichenbachiella carrageenanivorans]UXX80993.1 T9SS type A sorting domain-containing protein [Reichenbachiella carrageenanivorans]
MIKILLKISLTLCMSLMLHTLSFASDVNILYAYNSDDIPTGETLSEYENYDEAYVTKLEAEGYTVTTMLYSNFSADVATNAMGFDLIIVGQGTANNTTQDEVAALDIPVLVQADVVSRYGFGSRIRNSNSGSGLAYTTSPSAVSESVSNAIETDIVSFAATSSLKGLDLSLDTQSADLIPIYSYDNNTNRLAVAALETGATYDQDAGTSPNRRGYFGVVNSSIAMNDDLGKIYIGLVNWLMDIHTITASSTSGGTIGNIGDIAIPGGKDKTFTFSPDPDYTVQDVVVDGVSQGVIADYTFTGVMADHTIAVRFVGAVTYTITASAEGQGSISPSGALITSAGFDETYSFIPDAGYEVKEILVDGNPVTENENYTFTTIGADHTIQAIFQPNTSLGGGSILYAYESPEDYTLYDQKYVETLTDEGFEVETILFDDLAADAATLSTGKDLIIVGYNTPNSNTQSNIANLPIPVLLQSPAVAKYGFAEKARSNNITSIDKVNPVSEAADIISNGLTGTLTLAGESQSKPVDQGTDVTSANLITVYNGGGTRYPVVALEAGVNGYVDPIDGTFLTTAARRGYFSVVDVNLVMNNDLATLYIGMVKWLMDFKRITATASTGGAISPAGNVEIYTGSSQGFEIIPNEGYEIADVLVNDASVGAVENYAFEHVTAVQTIAASFSIITYDITASAGANGAVAPSGAVAVDYGTTQTFTFTPDDTYRVLDVLVDGSSVGAVDTYSFTNVKETHTVAVSFELIPKHEIVSSAGENGSISPEGTHLFYENTDVRFDLTPDLGYEVADVLVDDASVGAVASYTFTDLLTAHTISASFVIQTFDITATAGDNGSISPEGITTVDYNGSQAYTITADEGYEVADVMVDGNSEGAVTSFTFESVTTTHSISVTFAKMTYDIAAQAGENGSISPEGIVSVDHNGSQTFTITADEGYEINDVLVNNESVGAIASYTFENVTAAQSISATFSEVLVITEVNPTTHKALKIYPNPSVGSFTIDTAGSSEILILTIDGKLVNRLNSSGSLSITGLNPGTYLIRTITNKRIEIQKLIIQ